MDVPALEDARTVDPLVGMVKTYNWYSWTTLRLSDRTSSEYRSGVNVLATRLVEATAVAQSTPFDVADNAKVGNAGELLGSVDKMALLEDTLPKWQGTLEAMSEQVVLVGDIGQAASGRIDKANTNPRPMAARLTVLRKLANDFREPASKILELGGVFADQLADVDQGMTTIIAQAPNDLKNDPSEELAVREFFRSVSDLVDSAEEGLGQMRELADTIQPIEAMSKDLRPPMRDIRRGLTLAYEGLGIMRGWQTQIKESGINFEIGE